MVASRSPARTIWPSLNSTFSITPETWGRTFTVAWGVTVPRASRIIGMLDCSAVATPTVVAGAERRPDAPAGAAVLPGASGVGWVSRQASQPVAASAKIATRPPTRDARRLKRLRGVEVATG